MSGVIELGVSNLLVAGGLVLVAVLLSWIARAGLERNLMVGAVRACTQLILIGYALKFIFDFRTWHWTILVLVVMILIAGREAANRQDVRLPGLYWKLVASIGVGALATTLATIFLVVRAHPWFEPQYLIPLGGMIVGNAMNAGALVVSRLASGLRTRVLEVEAALSLGATWQQASAPVYREALRSAMIPIVNTLMVIGLVQLPGMMTGQLLAGASPRVAVGYQLVIVYALACANMITAYVAGHLCMRQFFTDAHQLRRPLLGA